MKKLIAVMVLIVCCVSFGQSNFGDWMYFENVDLITDENTSLIVAEASEYPSLARYSALIVRCDAASPDGVEVYFYADRYLGGSAGTDSVTYRFDKDDAITETWYLSTDWEALFAPYRIIPGFLSRVNTAGQVIFRVSSLRETYTYVVPVAGFNDALYRLGCYTGQL